MKTTAEKYKTMVEQSSPNSPLLKNMAKAFVGGGTVCVLGELLAMLYARLGAGEELVRMLVPVTLIALTALLTAIGVYDKIARHAGAGTIVPITGFANAIASPAMEFQTEGRILGTGANIFRLAGPVLVYGGGAAVLYGIIYWLFAR
ncbi:MAG: SpoVA/SpoVAEb family sporulation membrane protein [Oscillospiraceae bacterium]|jgi:stage V sporulation protein AC|nr:SpoVA/SpoVAEb family sporulation membrane protein [Oscillospiraceae bacterium]